MVQYYGDFAEDQTVYLPFNTFTSNDPSASCTITDLLDADIKVHKDGSTDEIATDGATIAINFDGVTGNHLITIDTSVDAAYATGSDYMVRIEGTTVDAGTINAWVGIFSIENRFNQTVVPDAAGTAPTASEIQSEMEEDGASLLDTIRDELANETDGLSALKDLIDAIPTTAMRGTDNAALASVWHVTRAGYLDNLVARLTDTRAGHLDQLDFALQEAIAALPTVGEIQAEMEENGESLLDTIRDEVQHGTYGLSALKTLIDAISASALLTAEIATVTDQTHFTLATGSDVDDAYNDMGIVLYDDSNNDYPFVRKITDYVGATKTVTIDLAAGFTLGTDDSVMIFTQVPGSTPPTVGEIQAEMEEEGASLLDTIRDELANETDGLSALKDLIDAVKTVVDAIQAVTDVESGVKAIADAIKTVTDALPEGGALTTLLANVAAILADTSTDGVALKAAGLNADAVDEIFDEVVEGTLTFRQIIRIFLAVLAGKSTGGGTTTPTFRDNADSKARVSPTVDANGNRTAMTLDGS